MKKVLRFTPAGLCLVLILAACVKDDREEEFSFEDENWERTCENIAQLKPLLISRKELVRRTRDSYYLGPILYQCSDSLGKACFWNCLNEPSFSFTEGQYYAPLSGNDLTEMFRLEEECGYSYKAKSYLSGVKPDPERSRPKEISWLYDESNGNFRLADLNMKTEMGTLVMVNKEYLILKQNRPMYTLSYPIYPDKVRVPTNATYTIIIYHAMEKSRADKYWYTEANYSQE